MAASTDPFSIVYDALWAMLEDDTTFTGLVKIGNRLRFASDIRNPTKLQKLTNDVPMVGILADGGLPHLQATSNSSFLTSKYIFMIVSGEQQLDRSLYPIAWEMFRAMSKWATRLQALTWSAKKFVQLARPVEFSELLSTENSKGILGWSARWDYEVKMFFTTSDVNP